MGTRIFKSTGLGLLLLLETLFGFGQATTLDSLVQQFDQYATRSLQEKLYVHTDRNFFLTGEILWFKIYCVDGSFHRPMDMSKVAYVELLDHASAPVLQAKVELKDASGNGSLFIPATLASGNYVLRAYTRWMKNYDPAFYFHKSLTIANPFEKTNQERGISSDFRHVQFFPEGGDMVSGITSKVAFKGSHGAGEGFPFSGTILSDSRDTVTRFTSDPFGVGSFTFTPQPHVRYTAAIQGNLDTNTTFHPLPTAHEYGFVMKVESTGNDNLSIDVSSKLLPNQIPLVYLFVHTRQKLIKAEGQFLKNNVARFTVRQSELGEGISHLTIFDAAQHPVCERLYFNPPTKNLKLTLATEKREFGTREEIAMQINIDSLQMTLTNLSVSVYRIDSLEANTRENIFSYLWLSSDLVTPLESPAFYFDQGNSETAKKIDNLMLTHGWRRFEWTDVIGKIISRPFVPEYRGHIIQGQVLTKTKTPGSGLLTYLSSPGRTKWIYTSQSNKQGELFFDVKNVWGLRRIIMQPSHDQDSLYTFDLQNPFSIQYANFRLPAFWLNPEKAKSLLSRSIAMQVQDVYYREKQNMLITRDSDSISFYGRGDERYLLDDYTRFTVMEEVMREYVKGVTVRKRKDGFRFLLLDKVSGGVLDESPLVLLDGVPVLSVDKIMDYDPLKVKSIEVVQRRYYLGTLLIPGVVSYSTYDGDMNGFQLDPSSISLNYEGLQLARKFHTPVYENQMQRASRMPDQRTLLYWEPELKVKDVCTVRFTSSDVAGDYRVVVEGINAEGYSGYATHTFTVHKKRP